MTHYTSETLEQTDTSRRVRFSAQAGVSEQQTITECLQAYLRQHPDAMLYPPQITGVAQSDQTLSFESLFSTQPELELPDPRQMVLQAPVLEPPSESQLRNELRALQVQYGQRKVVQRPAQWGDLLIVDAYALVNEQVVPGSIQARWPLLLDPLNQEDPFLQGLLGAIPGKVITLPKPQQPELLSHLHLLEVIELQIPVADDHFAQVLEMGNSLDEMLDQLYQGLKDRQRQQWLTEVKAAVVQAYCEQVAFTPPDGWIAQELLAECELSDLVQSRQLQQPIKVDHQLRQSWLQTPALQEEQARQIRHRLILAELARQHQLEPTEAEIEQSLQAFGNDSQQLRADLITNQQWHLWLNALLLEKAARFLLKQAQVYAGDQRLPF